MRILASVIALGGCMNAAADPPLPSKAPVCSGTFELEARRWRAHPNMATAEALPIDPANPDEMSTTPMDGPYPSPAKACPDCEDLAQRPGVAPFDSVAAGNGALLVRIGASWWTYPIGRWSGSRCTFTADAPRLVDMNRSGRGAELLLRTEEACTSENHPDPADAEGDEFVVICGVGRSNKPACATAHLGVNSFAAEYSQHTRWQFACNGIATITHWELPDYRTVYRAHRRIRLEFP